MLTITPKISFNSNFKAKRTTFKHKMSLPTCQTTKMQKGLNKVNSLENTEVVEGDLALSLDEFYDKYKKVQQGEMSVGLQTGFPTFDKSTGGLKAGELDIVIAGSNEGKSVFLINVAKHLYLQDTIYKYNARI